MSFASRSRGSLFGEESAIKTDPNDFDPETAERENDREIEKLAERASMLKRITSDIHDEAERHNTFLDNMQGTMDNAKNLLAGTMDRFTKVFDTKGGKNMLYLVSGFVVFMLFLYYTMM
mmetsp:Transcript_18555/g.31190  ORF Transcript_18555/g.31190 Transcript_18555/m.31190 type:complete len:119 (+) Transcript_18555:204-560(+)|eukprot:CAMPEP_0198210784 /NCGR_PEP_ID=MMETSP1445-20131203/22373_1 /TAXON_ID=36898 /ORGANISM="Pyramimonas sp., Strain CCMP2087" /LENGTH=118 /DNA_ID=CAMNT_0043884929 /DNA_START=204 /DNA_END=560 /DNA_ORIENTATION=+